MTWPVSYDGYQRHVLGPVITATYSCSPAIPATGSTTAAPSSSFQDAIGQSPSPITRANAATLQRLGVEVVSPMAWRLPCDGQRSSRGREKHEVVERRSEHRSARGELESSPTKERVVGLRYALRRAEFALLRATSESSGSPSTASAGAPCSSRSPSPSVPPHQRARRRVLVRTREASIVARSLVVQSKSAERCQLRRLGVVSSAR
jgi:hypothetical protein